MLSRQSWWPAAEHLEVGDKRRVNHDCGDGRTLIVSRDQEGYRAYCFRCSDNGWSAPPAESLAEKLARLEAARRGDQTLALAAMSVALPNPAVRDVGEWPAAAALWLYKAGLSKADIGRLGIYYHAPSDRVVLPVLDALGAPLWWQARAYQKGRMPKYLGPTPRPAKLVARWGSSAIPTLTEDMLSAMKIGMVAEGWAVMGTSISDHYLSLLMKRGRVNVWLDPDKAGRRAAAKYVKQLRAYGLEVRDIVSTADPKLHTLAAIKEYLYVDHAPAPRGDGAIGG